MDVRITHFLTLSPCSCLGGEERQRAGACATRVALTAPSWSDIKSLAVLAPPYFGVLSSHFLFGRGCESHKKLSFDRDKHTVYGDVLLVRGGVRGARRREGEEGSPGREEEREKGMKMDFPWMPPWTPRTYTLCSGAN